MQISKKKYGEMAKAAIPPSKKIRNSSFAFLIGGAICAIAQGIYELYDYLGMSDYNLKLMIPVTMVFLGSLLTALNVYHQIARYGGAGTLVPITGFANAIVSPAMEFKAEGHIMGIGAKMFTIAGPVIVFGTLASVAYGIVYWVVQMFWK